MATSAPPGVNAWVPTASSASSRSPTRAGQALRRGRRLLVEQRHLRGAGLGLAQGDARTAAGDPALLPGRLRRRREPGDTVRLGAEAFSACPSDSIDYAVMEKLHGQHDLHAMLVPLEAGWSDVGSWAAIWDIAAKDAAGNVGRGRVVFDGASACPAHSEGRLIACVGVQDVVVVETADAVLVVAKSRVQDVKNVVQRLRAEHGSEVVNHRKVRRPWGCFDAIDRGERFQSSASWWIRARACRCRCTTTAPSTGRGARHRARDLRRHRQHPVGEPVDLYPDRHAAPAREPAGRRWRSSRCSPALTSGRMTSCASTTTTDDVERDGIARGKGGRRPGASGAEYSRTGDLP